MEEPEGRPGGPGLAKQNTGDDLNTLNPPTPVQDLARTDPYSDRVRRVFLRKYLIFNLNLGLWGRKADIPPSAG